MENIKQNFKTTGVFRQERVINLEKKNRINDLMVMEDENREKQREKNAEKKIV